MRRRDATTTGQGTGTPDARWANEGAAQPAADWMKILLRVVGAGLLIAAGAIHLDLYVTGYRTIPTIGWLFLLQVIVAFALGLAVLVIPSRLVVPSRIAAASGALFALSTLGGYLLTVWIGLFGFKEVRTTAGIAAGVIEIVAFVILAALALAPLPSARTARTSGAGILGQIPAPIWRAARATAAALTVAALVLFGVALANAASTPTSATMSAGTALKTTTIGGVTVLTNSKGLTLYSFAPDTPTTSKCYGSCAAYWPPAIGTAAAGSGLPGKTGTIKRTDGSLQLTYNGHPLYTYVGDSGPGQANGNNLNLNGGLWHEVPASR